MQNRVIMLVDFDYFFAQCEEIRNPTLKDKPVVVCVYSGRTPESGAVSTANYIARKHGVHSGIPIALAKKKLEGTEAAFLPVDHTYYEQVSDKIMAILRSHADAFQQTGIDEAYLDVTQKTNADFTKAQQLAQTIKHEIKAQQGITCSIGIGPNKLIAKIAADAQKPDGLTTVKPEEAQNFLDPLPVDRLIGIGKKTTQKMQNMRIHTIRDLACYEVQRLIEVYGKKLGTYFHNAANGTDNTPVQEAGETESISRIATLKQNTRDINAIMEKADQLCDDIHKELTERKLHYAQVTAIAIMNDLTQHTRSKALENPTNHTDTLKETAKELFQKLLEQTDHEIRRVGVKTSDFTRKQEQQKQLTGFIR